MDKPVIVQNDPWLNPHTGVIAHRAHKIQDKIKELLLGNKSLKEFASGHLYFGLHRTGEGWVLREWAPNATAIFLIGEFNNWQESDEYLMQRIENGQWIIKLSHDKLHHGQLFKLSMHWEGGRGERIPSYIKRVVQDEQTKTYNAQVWGSGAEYKWKHPKFQRKREAPIIYEAHVGMAQDDEKVGTYIEFKENVLPDIVASGYNTIQLMAIQEHPYYGSFGYHVSNYFAVSSRFGTPDELKDLIDAIHDAGLAVIMDIVHSHSVRNEIEGLARFDGTGYQYFHDNFRREHVAWDSLCFDYGKNEVLHFLLSNCRFWLEEYNFDGFRFDGVTSMLYLDHGLERDFTSYDYYFDGAQDEDAIIYMALANTLIHEVKPTALSLAEEMSGMPGIAAPIGDGGYGFDYRLSMGIPDYWIKIIKEKSDEHWNVEEMFNVLAGRRAEEKTIGYCESHDQALVGDKTIIFRLIDKDMYWFMDKSSENLLIDRGIALHKIIRLITIGASGGGYLTFMGNEFGHPEWIDFPREGNNWSYKYAKRQWKLKHHPELKYHYLADFDRDMINLMKEEKTLDNLWVNKIFDNGGDQVIAFERGDLIFVFNFNPNQSFTDYGIGVFPGKFKIVLNTDNPAYGGNGLIDDSMLYFAEKAGHIDSPYYLKLYLPSRVGLVLKRLQTKKVH